MSLGTRLIMRKVPRSFSQLHSLHWRAWRTTKHNMHNLRQQFLQKMVTRKGMKLQSRNRYITKLSMYDKVCSLFLKKRRQSRRSVISWRMQYSLHKSGWSWILVESSWPHSTASPSQTQRRLCHSCLEPAELPWNQGTWRRNSVSEGRCVRRKTCVDYGRRGRRGWNILTPKQWTPTI